MRSLAEATSTTSTTSSMTLKKAASACRKKSKDLPQRLVSFPWVPEISTLFPSTSRVAMLVQWWGGVLQKGHYGKTRGRVRTQKEEVKRNRAESSSAGCISSMVVLRAKRSLRAAAAWRPQSEA